MGDREVHGIAGVKNVLAGFGRCGADRVWRCGLVDVKTVRLYVWAMASRLLNVRLTPEDERAVAQLRARGVSISEIMRRALRAEVARNEHIQVDAESLVAELQARFPTPSKPSSRRVDATDRDAVREHIKKRLRARA